MRFVLVGRVGGEGVVGIVRVGRVFLGVVVAYVVALIVVRDNHVRDVGFWCGVSLVTKIVYVVVCYGTWTYDKAQTFCQVLSIPNVLYAKHVSNLKSTNPLTYRTILIRIDENVCLVGGHNQFAVYSGERESGVVLCRSNSLLIDNTSRIGLYRGVNDLDYLPDLDNDEP